MISFDNTEYAFAGKSKMELKKTYFLFSIMNIPWLIKLGLKITPLAIKNKFPFIKPTIRNTIFHQFVGGETLEQTAKVANKLQQYNVQVILDYGAEGGQDGEQGFDFAMDEFIRVINYAATQKNIPFMSIKITALARFDLLEKMDAMMNDDEEGLFKRYAKAIQNLTTDEQEEWDKVCVRVLLICEAAQKNNIGVLIDAEETWIQDPVDALAEIMMEKFNQQKPVVYNTVQLYRHDRLQFLKDSFETATIKNFVLAVKLVRGAYMEKERKRADENQYPSPIQPDKSSTDKDYNAAIDFCFGNIDNVSFIVASHNEQSCMLAAEIAEKKTIAADHPHLHFSQLYGMSDNISFNLAKAGFNVSKYIPFGPIKDVIPYLMRRAQENSSVGGQSGRELSLIEKELKRRKIG
ncbi:proline dehydrogenase family protein [Ferruginibacter albus]|uniref:proline dehydrogenase family protein n=1 Tax=Ferruginibacter albus TaxID=2875540 RepID=UPI001CC80A0F|nr:proline dehydrogenase family protein [Ferruginibacter albus]UAY52654.1 proline dehydrogenase family protein [Ferruginibacter albus]